MAAAYYAVRGIRPADFLKFPNTEKLFMIAAMERDFERENKKLESLAKIVAAATGAKLKRR